MTIFEKLIRNANDSLPMHMPGHKRKTDLPYLEKLAADIDITEIDGFDDLHDPSGIILEAERRAAGLWKAENSHILVGGSTVGILAAIYSHVRSGDVVLMARNCHKSVYHAVEICGAVPKYITEECDKKTGICKDITPLQIQNSIKENADAKLIIITSPTYEGVISDIHGIARVAHGHGIPLLVDEAHGAHLDLGGSFVGGAVSGGADIVVQSLHKTLPSLTQTAVAHVGGLADDAAFMRALDIFETSSPSYLLMAAADGCVDFISRNAHLLDSWSARLYKFRQSAKELEKLRLFDGDGCFGFDKSKIIISTADADISGYELMRTMRYEHGIELEAAGLRHAVAMTGIFDGDDAFERLAIAAKEIDARIGSKKCSEVEARGVPEQSVCPADALKRKAFAAPKGDAVGRISAEYIYSYPPGIPLIVPGEIFTEDIIDHAENLLSLGAKVIAGDKSLKTFYIIEK